jgi:competence protein ComEC
MQPNVMQNYSGKVFLCGQISSLVNVTRWGQSFKLLSSSVDNTAVKINWHVFFSKHYPWFQGGERWCFNVLASENSFGMEAKIVAGYKKIGTSYSFYIFHLRRKLAFLINKSNLHADDKAFFIALCLGIRSQITTEQWDVLQHTGTSHLIAIAGLHIGLVFFGCFIILSYFMPRIIPVRYNINSQKVALFIALFFSCFYAVISGLSPPALRAILMLSVIASCRLLDRKNQIYDSYYIAGMIIIIFVNPAISNISFGLSFVAAYSVIYLFAAIVKRQHKFMTHLIAHIKLSLLLAPWICLYFSTLSFVSIICNMLAIPIVTIIIAPIGLIAISILLLFPAVGYLLLQFAAFFFHVLWHILKLFGQGYWMIWMHPINSYLLCLIYFFSLLVLFGGLTFFLRFIAILLFIPFFYNQIPRPLIGDFIITTIQAQKENLYLLTTNKANYLIGTGMLYKHGLDDIHQVTLRYLYQKNIKHLDGIIVGDLSPSESNALTWWQAYQPKLRVYYLTAGNCTDVLLRDGVVLYFYAGKGLQNRCSLSIYGANSRAQFKYQLHLKRLLIYH